MRQACLLRGWSLGDLAGRAGVSRTTLHQLLSGATRRPQLATVSRIAAALELPADDLWRRACPPAVAGGKSAPSAVPARREQHAFDRRMNPAIGDVCRERPELFSGWKPDEWDELCSSFGVGGALRPEGVVAVAEGINHRREIVRKLHIVLETHLGDVAAGLIDSLYQKVQPDARAAAASTEMPQPGADEAG